ncbi:MAG: ribosome-associated translation inhibitor RaiA [Chloroflexi bacterium]|nr:ribosome-associated translation inhibitor RaiA [Chloroflexota bacterium]
MSEVPVEIALRDDLKKSEGSLLAERLHDYATKKVQRLLRYFPNAQSIRVDLSYDESARNAQERATAQITFRAKRMILRSEERADDIFAALDAAVDKMQRRIERVKGRRFRRGPDREAVAEEVAAALAAEEAEPEEAPRIVRRKRFELIPMDEAEAIEQMELLGHDCFFIFFNARTNRINVLYKRRDGTYGVIEPELG